MYQLLLDTGYSASSAHSRDGILRGIQLKLDPIVNQLIEKRDLAFDAMTEQKFKKTGLSTLAYIVDIFTKMPNFFLAELHGEKLCINQ